MPSSAFFMLAKTAVTEGADDGVPIGGSTPADRLGFAGMGGPGNAEARNFARAYRGPLGALPAGLVARVVTITDEADVVAWLEAFGISVGETVTVLRRASFGGPLHVRTGSSGEFAVDLTLARRIDVESEGPV